MHEVRAFLCGYFTRNIQANFEKMESDGWEQKIPGDKYIADMKRIYYPEFVDFCFADTDADKGCVELSRKVGEKMAFATKSGDVELAIDDLSLYLMPMDVTLLKIGVSFDVDDLNKATAVLASLRMVDYYSAEDHGEFMRLAIDPLLVQYRALTGSDACGVSTLVEQGNKFRIFQIINSHTSDDNADMASVLSDVTLYQMGSVSKVTKGELKGSGVSEVYLNKILDESRVSVFDSWHALALNDTFTVHGENLSPKLIAQWSECYFGMIYLHSLMVKSFLFGLNVQLREALQDRTTALRQLSTAFGVSRSPIDTLVQRFEEFERKCCFHKVSYNFLPVLLDEAIDKGLCIAEEKEQLYGIIDKEKGRRDAANDRLVNGLLFVLSLLTLFSAIWDFSCLINEMYPYSDYFTSSNMGYRLVTLLVLVLLVGVVSRLFSRRK